MCTRIKSSDAGAKQAQETKIRSMMVNTQHCDNLDIIIVSLKLTSEPPWVPCWQQDGVNRLKKALQWQDRQEKFQSWRTYLDKNNVHHASWSAVFGDKFDTSILG
jgi:hypothetical protein